MIIDLILDRKGYEEENPGVTWQLFAAWMETEDYTKTVEYCRRTGRIIQRPYHPRDFYRRVMEYGGYFADQITYSMDYLDENRVKAALCKYIVDNDYNPQICDFVNAVKWLAPAGE